jgi:RimJ/RimL family protein N-acetyltransferase
MTLEIVLRAPREDDAEDLIAACNDPQTLRFVPTLPAPYTKADALRWVNEVAPGAAADGSAHYVVADPTTDRLLGAGGFYRGRETTAEIGYWVAPWARGQGVATAAARAQSVTA